MNECSYKELDMKGGNMRTTDIDCRLLDKMTGFFKALADETRLKILFSLLGSSKCVMHLSESVEMSQSAVSHQLAVLKNAGLVKVARSGKNHVYSIADEHVRLVVDMAKAHADE